ncbi:MAG: carbohydrate-binding protein, partial [Deltaproteobacteria bacterium]
PEPVPGIRADSIGWSTSSDVIPGTGSGWRASQPGEQTFRLLFDKPLRLKLIRLVFQEDEQERTQEFVLRWSPDGGQSYREIVRQQYNFSPPQAAREIEEYDVDLDGVTALELRIVPEISGGSARASLAQLRLV